MTIKSDGMKSEIPKRIGLLLVLASLLAIVVLYALDISFLYEPKHLLGDHQYPLHRPHSYHSRLFRCQNLSKDGLF